MVIFAGCEQGHQMSLQKNCPKCCPTHFMLKLTFKTFTMEKVAKTFGLFKYFSKNCPKKKVSQNVKIRPIWSPWLQDIVTRYDVIAALIIAINILGTTF
jgi:hypothetical protein